MTQRWLYLIRPLILLSSMAASWPLAAAPVEFWLTTEDMKQTLSPQPALTFAPKTGVLDDNLIVDDSKTFQTILGLGSSLEPTTCSNFWRMAVADREALTERIVDPDKGIGMNLMRI